jgi:glycosyltransferase involved in cell wall biosynthesis
VIVALLTDGLTPFVMGGMQRHSRLLCEHLAMQGVEVCMFHCVRNASQVSSAAGVEWLPESVRSRVHVELVDYPPLSRMPGHYLREQAEYSRRLLDRYLRSGTRPDFIYAQGLTGAAFIDHRDRGHPMPPIGVNLHGLNMYQRAPDLRTALQHLMLRPSFARVARGADVVFCFSGAIRGILEDRVGIPPARLAQVPNAIDPSWVASAPTPAAATRRFTFIGRHDRCKGLPELCRAIDVLGAGPWSLRIIGPVPQALRVPSQHVQYVGAIAEPERVAAMLDDSDCLVCPSHSEGMPTVVIEAMARGNAIIATDVGATRELVDSSNGFLIARPEVGLIANAMRCVLAADETALLGLKASSIARAAGYTWPRVARMHIDEMATRIVQPRLGR